MKTEQKYRLICKITGKTTAALFENMFGNTTYKRLFIYDSITKVSKGELITINHIWSSIYILYKENRLDELYSMPSVKNESKTLIKELYDGISKI